MRDEVLILGGGVAGCAAAIALARKGRAVTLIEREPTPRHKVCGEFLSGEALEDLHALGIDVGGLGAVPIDHVRLAAARRAAEAPLPFPAASLTRKALDTALIAEAVAAGVCVEQGRSVKGLERTAGGTWKAALDDGTTREAATAFLATGKRDLRGYARAEDPQRCVAFKIYFVMAWRSGRTKLLQSSLTRAVIFSAATTATAFGSLWLSSHPGTSSMGKLLALSLACTLAAAVLFQPALMGKPRTVEDV